MVTPLTLVVDVHALFALAGCLGQRAVGLDDRFFKECGRLLLPDLHPHVVDDVHQGVDVAFVEAAAKVTGGGRVGDSPRAQRVEVDFVVAPQLEVFQAGSAGQDVVGDVEHVVRLVVGQVHLEQPQPTVDGVNQAGSPGQQMHGPDPARTQAAGALGQFVMNVGGGEHGFGLIGPAAMAEPILNSALAVDEFSCSTGAHSKCLLAQGNCPSLTP